MARVIARSVGPSGRNSEYLFMLEEALEGLGEGSGDGHVEDLARRVRVMMGDGVDEDGVGVGRRDVAKADVEMEIGRVGSGEGGRANDEAEKAV